MKVTKALTISVRVVLIAACVLLAAYFSAVAVMKTRRFRSWARHRIVVELEHATGARAEIGALGIDPAIFQFTLRNLTLHGLEPGSAPPLLTARLIVVRLNPLSVVRGKLLISRLFAQGVELHGMSYPDGSTNLPGATSDAGRSVTDLLNFSIGKLDLLNAELYWNDQRIPLDLEARHAALLLYFRKASGYWGSWSVSPVRLRGRGYSFPAATLAARVRITRHALTLSNVTWKTPGAQGLAAARLTWAPHLAVTGALRGRGKLREIARALEWKPIQGGEFQGECSAVYRDGKFSARGRLSARQVSLRVPGFAPAQADLISEFTASPQRVSLSNLRVSALGGFMTGSGEIQLEAPRPEFNLDLVLHGLSLDKTLRMTSRSGKLATLLALESRIDGTARVSWAGSLKDLQSLFDVQLTPARFVTNTARALTGRLTGSARLSPSLQINVQEAQLRTARSSLTAQGGLGAHSNLQVHYSTTDFQEAEPLLVFITGFTRPVPLQLKAAIVFSGSLNGRILQPEFRGEIQAGDFSFEGWAWNSFSALLDATPGHLQITDGRVRSGPSTFGFDSSLELADWKLRPDSKVSITVEARGSPLQGFIGAAHAHYPVTGLATGQAHLAGTISKLTGSANFELMRGTADQEPFDSLSARVSLRGSVWRFQDVQLKKGTGTANGRLDVDWPRRWFSADFQGSDFSLAQFKHLQRLPAVQVRTAKSSFPLAQLKHLQQLPAVPGKAAKSSAIKGEVDFRVHGDGNLAEPTVQIQAGIRQIVLDGSPAGDLQASLGFSNGRMEGNGRLSGAGGGDSSFTLDAITRNDWPAKLQGRLTDFRMDPWLSWLGNTHLDFPIAFSGFLSGTGPLRHPRGFTVTAQVQSLRVAVPGFALKNDQPVSLRYKEGVLESNLFRMRGPSTDVMVRIGANWSSQPTVSMDFNGNAHASILKLLDPSIEAAGGFGLNIHVAGPITEPALAGDIAVQNLTMRFGGIPLILAGLNGRIALKGNQATIVSLSGASGQSSIQVTGSALVGRAIAYDISARFQSLRFEYPVDCTSLLNGDVHLTGSSKDGDLSGDVVIQQMFASQSFNVVNWIGQMGSTLGEQSATAASPLNSSTSLLDSSASPLASKIRLNLQVTSNPEIRLVSRTLSFVATLDMALRGTVARPVATGDIRLQQGQALVAGNRYQIPRGEITMTGPFQNAPVLDIEAHTRVDRYNLTIDITGPADRARLAYRSDPPLPTEDILSLLALGYTPQQQLMRSTGSQPFGALGASALLSQALSSQVSGRVQQLFGVSRIRIDPNLMGPASAGGARITIEEQVSRDLTLTYSTNTAAAEQRDIRLRWDLSNKISLIGERDINGVYGFEIRFNRQLK